MKREALRNICAFLLIIFISLFFLQFISICQNQFANPKNLIKQKDLLLVIENQDKKFSLEIYTNNLSFDSYFIGKTFLEKRKIKLSGYEKDIKLFNSIAQKDGEQYLVCLYGDVGVHSQNIQIISIGKNGFKTVKIIDKEKTELINAVTDYPGFNFYNDDEKLILTLDHRDYDKDPTLFAKKEVYIYKDGHFSFDREEDISYDSR